MHLITRLVAFCLAAMWCSVAAAALADLSSLLGKNWYGLYLHGKKAGFSSNELSLAADGTVVYVEDARFQISMAGSKQDLHVFSKRTYSAEGALLTIESEVTDPAGTSKFSAAVVGDLLELKSVISGELSTASIPKPKETLDDAVKYAKWVQGDPQPGATLAYSTFEPMYQKELEAKSTVAAIEERVLDGVTTKVYKIETRIELMGVNSTSYVAQNGTILEDLVAGIITMRLEPEDVAKDVTYENDVIVSNAALVDKPISEPRKRKSLLLRIRGPLEPGNIFNDERQSITQNGDGFDFVSKMVTLEGFTPAVLPVLDEDAKQWLAATQFIQSDHPKLKAKAAEIVAGETDTRKASDKLCAWVYKNMKSSFSARLSNALEVLEHLEGDCTEHSTLFIGLARAAGIPARECAGLIYVHGPQPGFYFHQWAKVWIGKWVDVDPTFNQPLADVTHIKLSEGDLFQQARIIPTIGNIKVEVLSDTNAP
jgi:transglutaminase-like putative cysteine protease